jgi:hypothetical protein
MKIEAAKLELIEWLQKLDNEQMLEALLFYKKNHETKDWADDLTPAQKKAVEQGLADEKAGRMIPSSEVWKKYGR